MPAINRSSVPLFHGKVWVPIHKAMMMPLAVEFVFTEVALVLILVRYIFFLFFLFFPS